MNTDGHDRAPNSDVDPKSIERGHEPDRVDVKPILYVGAALLVTFVLAYTTVTLTINYLRAPSTEKPDYELAANRNDAPVKERLARTSSSDPHADFKQPRLEGLERLTTEDKPFVRSSEPTKTGNSPHYHADDMRPSSAHGKALGLQDYSWVDEKKGIVRLPYDRAMKLALSANDPKNPDKKFLASEDKVKVDELSKNQPTSSNPQRSATPKKDQSHEPVGGEH